MAGERLFKLRELLSELTAGKHVSVERAFREMLEIFEDLVTSLDGTTLEVKEEILAEMQEMSALLSREAPTLYAKAGVEEDQLEALSQTPESFSHDTWQLIQNARERLNDLAQIAAKMLGASVLDQKMPPTSPQIKPGPSKHHQGPPKRSSWMKT